MFKKLLFVLCFLLSLISKSDDFFIVADEKEIELVQYKLELVKKELTIFHSSEIDTIKINSLLNILNILVDDGFSAYNKLGKLQKKYNDYLISYLEQTKNNIDIIVYNKALASCLQIKCDNLEANTDKTEYLKLLRKVIALQKTFIPEQKMLKYYSTAADQHFYAQEDSIAIYYYKILAPEILKRRYMSHINMILNNLIEISKRSNDNQLSLWTWDFNRKVQTEKAVQLHSLNSKSVYSEVTNNILEKKISEGKRKTEKQKIITYSISIGLALIVVFSVIVFRRLQITRKQKIIIEEQGQILSETNEELNQTNEELATQRDEIEKQKEVVEEAHNEIKDSINYAKRIQNAILPAPILIKEHLPESFVLYKPKDVVAGDFYWLEAIASPGNKSVNSVLFAAADCTGHGVPGAMVSVVCHNAMNRAVREFGLTEPGLLLDKTRDIVVAEFEKSEDDVKDGMDIALCSLSGNTLLYAGAHNPLWIVRNNEILETKADKQPIGKFDKSTPYVTHKFELQKGDSIYIFSDGYADQFGGEKDKKFGSKRFKELLISIQEKSMSEQKDILNKNLTKWMKESYAEQLDDVCVMGVKI